MAALVADLLTRSWKYGRPSAQRRPGAGTYAALKIGYLGGVQMAVDGVGQPLLSGTDLAAACTTIAGADGNGGLIFRARRAGVRVQLLAGATKTLGITIAYGATIDVLIQQGTDGGGATTNTAAAAANAVWGHALASKLLAVKPTGTGLGLTATASATAIAHIHVLGVPIRQIPSSPSLITLDPSTVFNVGDYGMQPAAGVAPTLVNSWVYLLNDAEISVTSDPFNFRAWLSRIDNGFYYVNLAKAK